MIKSTQANELDAPGFSSGYSGFDSALTGNLDARRHFPIRGPCRQVFVCGEEENAAAHDLPMATSESMPLKEETNFAKIAICGRGRPHHSRPGGRRYSFIARGPATPVGDAIVP
jgi:hypothetical protein